MICGPRRPAVIRIEMRGTVRCSILMSDFRGDAGVMLNPPVSPLLKMRRRFRATRAMWRFSRRRGHARCGSQLAERSRFSLHFGTKESGVAA